MLTEQVRNMQCASHSGEDWGTRLRTRGIRERNDGGCSREAAEWWMSAGGRLRSGWGGGSGLVRSCRCLLTVVAVVAAGGAMFFRREYREKGGSALLCWGLFWVASTF